MSSAKDKFVEYPEIGKDYRHYKGGKYNVLTMAKHSEADEIKKIIEKIRSEKILQGDKNFLLDKLESIICDSQVVYKSIHFGTVSIRPLSMWFEKIEQNDVVKRFTEIKE